MALAKSKQGRIEGILGRDWLELQIGMKAAEPQRFHCQHKTGGNSPFLEGNIVVILPFERDLDYMVPVVDLTDLCHELFAPVR